MGKGEKSALEAIRNAEKAKILSFYRDNGSEFLNWHLMKYFIGRSNPVVNTLSRIYQSNDNVHFEGKNWTHIIQYVVSPKLCKP